MTAGNETYVPEKPKRQRWTTYRRFRKRLVTTPTEQPELDELASLDGPGKRHRIDPRPGWQL